MAKVLKLKILLPQFHIKLRTIKQFVKTLLKDVLKFNHLSDEKFKEGIFVGLEIRKLIQDTDFEKTTNKSETLGNDKSSWNIF